jgi:hypothetical protein
MHSLSQCNTSSGSLISQVEVNNPYTSTEENTENVGKVNPITLQVVNILTIKETIGEKITRGNYGTIYRVNDSSPPRVYKIIPQDQFADGNEIRISKIAADIGVAPSFHRAFLVRQNVKNYVVIEMDYADKSLGKLMEDLAEDAHIDDNRESMVAKDNALSSEEKAFQEMRRKFKAQMDSESGLTVTEIIHKKRLSLEEAVEKIYENPEVFYNELFSKIKTLAENNIAYSDSHVGNIMPNHNTEKGLQLIDFDAATLMTDARAATVKSMQSAYNRVHFNKFKELPGLSDNSKKLIQWFTNQSGFFA